MVLAVVLGEHGRTQTLQDYEFMKLLIDSHSSLISHNPYWSPQKKELRLLQMEKMGSKKQIQGGDDGVSFSSSAAMLRIDQDQYLKIWRESILKAGLKFEEEKKVMVGTGKSGPNEAEQNEGLVGRSFQPVLYFTKQNCIDAYLPTSVQLCIWMQLWTAGETSRNWCQPEAKWTRSVPAFVRELCQKSAKKWVPGIFKTMERTVVLGLLGDPLCQHIAVRKLNTAEKRKTVIGVDHYYDKYWDNIGNKRLLLSIQELIRFGSDGSNGESVDEEGDNAEWNEEIAKFHEKWDLVGNPCALSILSKQKKI